MTENTDGRADDNSPKRQRDERDNQPQRDSSVGSGVDNRRSVLRKIGMATVGTLSFGATSGAADPTDLEAADVGVSELTGDAKQKAIAAALSSSEFKTLRDYFKTNDDRVVNVSDAQVFETTDDDGQTYRVVSFQTTVRGNPDSEDARTNIAVALRNGKEIRSKATRVKYKDETGVVTSFSVERGSVEKQSKTIDLSLDETSNDVSAQISVCGYCIELERFICAVGCTIGLAAICLLFSLAPPAGLACAAVGGALCYILDRAGGCELSARYNCYLSGYCSSP